MNRLIIQLLMPSCLLIFLQIFVLNQIELHQYIRPIIYPLIILMLPLNTPRSLVLLIGLAIGLIMDVSSNTLGLHASVCVLIAYLRYWVLRFHRPRGDFDAELMPSVSSYGWSWYLIYAGSLLFIHQCSYFFLEIFSFQYLGETLMKVVFSFSIGLMLILLFQFLFYPTK